MKYLSKHIGIVGCSAEGAALCYKTICIESSKFLGLYAHPEISMHTHSFKKYVEYLNTDDLQGIASLMLSSAQKLKMQGAEFLICPDNTIHKAFKYVEPNSPLPWLHIADVVTEEAKKRGFKNPGLLGTRWLVESNVYPEMAEAKGLTCVRPDAKEINEIGRLIMEELVQGKFIASTIAYFQQVIKNLKNHGCDAVILGCTEIPLIINDSNSVLPTLSSNHLLAEAAIKYAVTEN